MGCDIEIYKSATTSRAWSRPLRGAIGHPHTPSLLVVADLIAEPDFFDKFAEVKALNDKTGFFEGLTVERNTCQTDRQSPAGG
jgi:hypothetical protein